MLRRLEEELSLYVVVKVNGVKGCPPDLMNDVAAAVDRANDAMDRDGEEIVWAAPAMPSQRGPVIYIDCVGTDEQTQEWLDHLAETLEAAGHSGEIKAAPHTFVPIKITDIVVHTLHPSALVAYTITPGDPSYVARGWRVDDKTTQAICRHAVDWSALNAAKIYLGEMTFTTQVSGGEVETAFRNATARSGIARLTYATTKPLQTRSVRTADHGQVAYTAGHEGMGWADYLDDLLSAMTRDPAAVDYALVRLTAGYAQSFLDLANGAVEMPYLRESIYRLNRHLWSSYVPDAHALQVLTRDHLEKANDLSGWKVQKLTEDRWLVEATDLRAWLDPELAGTDVIDAARTDFGAMIMTHQIADEHGWVPGRPIP